MVSVSQPVHTRRPLSLSLSHIATVFFGVGLLMVLVEAAFYGFFSGLSTTSFTTRTIIGFHLFPSELWFVFFGNALAMLILAHYKFQVPKEVAISGRPVFLALAVFGVWFVYGALVGNSWALQEFREMVFTGFSLPAILVLAPHVDARMLFQRWLIIPGTAAIPVIALSSMGSAALGIANVLLHVALFIVAYFVYQLVNGRKSALLGLGAILLPFVLSFAKPMIALLAFTFFITFVFAAYFNRASVNWILSKFKLRMAVIALSLLALLLLLIFAINSYYDGIIEHAVRYFYLKERLTETGELRRYGDVTGGRLAVWSAAIEAWKHKPLFGYGLGSTISAFAPGSGWLVKVQFHNYLIQALHNTGLVGTIVAVGAWLVWLRATVGFVRKIEIGREQLIPACMLIYVIGVFFYGLYGHSLSHPPAAQMFWLCVGFLCAAPIAQKERLGAAR